MKSINHVAIIMDGNGRWGIKKKKTRNFGHEAGLKTIDKIINFSIKKKIPHLTLFVFSTENWKRPKYEIIFLFNLLHKFLNKNLDQIHQRGIKIKFIGTHNKFTNKIKKVIEKTELKTKKNNIINVNLALNYGFKSELIQSINNIIKDKKKISEHNIDKNLQTSHSSSPDILIRTGGKKRLSNFMLWQLAYSELFFLDKLWPDFNGKDFSKILNRYNKIKRNFGSI